MKVTKDRLNMAKNRRKTTTYRHKTSKNRHQMTKMSKNRHQMTKTKLKQKKQNYQKQPQTDRMNGEYRALPLSIPRFPFSHNVSDESKGAMSALYLCSCILRVITWWTSCSMSATVASGASVTQDSGTGFHLPTWIEPKHTHTWNVCETTSRFTCVLVPRVSVVYL